MALIVVTTPSGSVSLTNTNVSKAITVTQGVSLWESDGVDHVKPKGDKTIQANYLELGGKVDVVSGKGLSTEDYTTAEKAKLAGLPEGTDLTTSLAGKVDTVAGKELSDNNYTDAEVTKVGYISGSGDGNLALYNNGTYRKANKSTGFTGTPTRTYDPVARTYTLSGTFKAYHNGIEITAIVNGWTSSPHADVSGIYYLRYDGTFKFDTTPFDIENDLLIGYAYYNSSKFGMSECHGLDMSGATHKHLHSTVGAYKSAGGDFSGYTLSSTTAANRRPDISETTVYDEDLKTVLEALTTKTYTLRYLTGTNTRVFQTDQTNIVPVLVDRPYYNQYTGGAWQQTLMDNNNYAAIFVAALPVTSDTASKKFRYVFVQPQTQSATLATIQALSPSSLTLGDSSTLVSEFVFIGKIIIQYTAANWVLTSVEKLEGTKISQIAIPASSVPSASSVSFSPVGSISATNVQSAIAELDSEKFVGNTAITGATKTKITYDAKGLVTSGADATTADIADSTDKRYCTDAQKTSLADAIAVNGIVQCNGSGDFSQYKLPKAISLYRDGALTVDTKLCSIISPFAMTVTEIRIAVDTAPTGANLIVDVNKNGTTMYTTQGNRPTIVATNKSATATDPDVTSIAVGDIISIDVDQIGSTVAGENLMVTIICEV